MLVMTKEEIEKEMVMKYKHYLNSWCIDSMELMKEQLLFDFPCSDFETETSIGTFFFDVPRMFALSIASSAL